MQQPNLANKNITAAQINAISNAAKSLENAITAIATPLTTEQRRSGNKMSERRRGFCDEAANIIKSDASFMARDFDDAEFLRDTDNYNALEPAQITMIRALELLNDTMMALGIDRYSSSLIVYQSLKTSNRGGQLDDLAKKLGRLFEGQGASTENSTPPATDTNPPTDQDN